MSATLVGFDKTRVTTTTEHLLGTTVIEGPVVYIYVKAHASTANNGQVGIAATFVTEVGTSHTNKTGATVPADSYYWVSGTDLSA